MNNVVYSNINKIIHRESKDTTYKFALLRGVIDIIHEHSKFISHSGGRVHIPTGLLVEKWMMYYYPILESSISQKNGGSNLAFEIQFKKIINAYKGRKGGFSAFYNDLKFKGIGKDLRSDFLELARGMRDTINNMPMKYIGSSINNGYYSIFKPDWNGQRNLGEIDLRFLIDNYGTFSIPADYFDAFEFLGSFISGQDSILFKWAEFSESASGKKFSKEKIIQEILTIPTHERDVNEADKIYRDILNKEGTLTCVWTDKPITSINVDHMIPFSVWKNNDLWNLLPTKPAINNKKRDKIPSVDLIEERKDLIIQYWDLLNAHHPQRFQKEIQIALLGNNPFSGWKTTAIKQLQSSCDYLITNRGYEEWKI